VCPKDRPDNGEPSSDSTLQIAYPTVRAITVAVLAVGIIVYIDIITGSGDFAT
jgi:hypothetical protein